MAGDPWGEFAFIERIRRSIRPSVEPTILGIGDDAAAVRVNAGMIVLAATDALVEEVHFRRRTTPPDALGWKAMAVNLSDIAAMGGRPTVATMALALPDDFPIEDVEELARGLDRCGERYGCMLAGGDTVL